MSLKDDKVKQRVIDLSDNGYNYIEIADIVGLPKSTVGDFLRGETYSTWWMEQKGKAYAAIQEDAVNLHAGLAKKKALTNIQGPKILTFDIETAPVKGFFWRLFKQNIGLNMIESDWYCLSWAAKWMHESEVQYMDKSETWEDEEDEDILLGIWELLDEADVVITQNGKAFDEKKLNARFILNGMSPPSSFKHIDTLDIAKRKFGFTSKKLEYMTDKLCKKYKKLKHGKFPGFELWAQCMKGNPEAWAEMKEYNIWDVLSLEELYTIMRPWDNKHPNFNLYYDDNKLRCKCGHESFTRDGYAYTNLSKFARYRCDSCGGEVRDRVNLLSKDKRNSIKMNII